MGAWLAGVLRAEGTGGDWRGSGAESPHPCPRRHTALSPAPTVLRSPLWDSAPPSVCAALAQAGPLTGTQTHLSPGAHEILFLVLSRPLSSSPPLPPPRPGRVPHTPPAALQAP